MSPIRFCFSIGIVVFVFSFITLVVTPISRVSASDSRILEKSNPPSPPSKVKLEALNNIISGFPSISSFRDAYNHALANRSSDPGSDACWNQLDYGLLQQWLDTNKLFCSPSVPNAPTVPNATSIDCRVMRLPGLPAPTGPHVICNTRHLTVDYRKLSPAPCLKYRPGYFCGELTYHSYASGALSGLCTRSPDFVDSSFPRDHLADIFNAFENRAPPSPTNVESGVTLFVTRERGEHVNLFHSHTDFLNVFLTMQMLDVDPNTAAVVLLDAHVAGSFDSLFDTAFSRRRPTQHARDLMNRQAVIHYEHAIFVPPGYSSSLFADLNGASACTGPVNVITAFSRHVLQAHGVAHPSLGLSLGLGRNDRQQEQAAHVSVAFVSRRPYSNAHVQHQRIGRQMSNEAALLSLLRAQLRVNVTVVEFSKYNYAQQLHLVSQFDLLIGMHGAGLTHLLWLPPWAGVLELRPKLDMGWWCYQHMAHWSGLLYDSWENRDPSKLRETESGDATEVNEVEFEKQALSLIDRIRQRKTAHAR